MTNVRCTFCGRYYKKFKSEDKCRDCKQQLKDIIEKMGKRYNDALEKQSRS